MSKRPFRSALYGAATAALLAGGFFLAAAALDGTALPEAAAYALIVAGGGAVLGGIVGTAVGLSGASYPGGALAGLLVTLAVVAFYVLAFARPGQAGYFLRESAVLVAVLGLPLVLTGLLTVWLSKRDARP